jgi:hypothetical protein
MTKTMLFATAALALALATPCFRPDLLRSAASRAMPGALPAPRSPKLAGAGWLRGSESWRVPAGPRSPKLASAGRSDSPRLGFGWWFWLAQDSLRPVAPMRRVWLQAGGSDSPKLASAGGSDAPRLASAGGSDSPKPGLRPVALTPRVWLRLVALRLAAPRFGRAVLMPRVWPRPAGSDFAGALASARWFRCAASGFGWRV